jgi:hypothetical protein
MSLSSSITSAVTSRYRSTSVVVWRVASWSRLSATDATSSSAITAATTVSARRRPRGVR